jgi:hypothetical protein
MSGSAGEDRVNRVQIWRTFTPNRAPDPNTLSEGELAVELASIPARLWVGAPGFNTDGQVRIGQASGGGTGGGATVTMGDAPPLSPKAGDLWWCSSDGNLYVRFNDQTSQQWVVAVNMIAQPGGGGGTDLTAGAGLAKTGSVLDVIGTANRVSVSTTVDIAATYVGQASITTLGTVATGTWGATTIAVGKGGTGATTLTGYVKGGGTTPLTASATIPNADVAGLGTMALQSASAYLALTGGTLSGPLTLPGNATLPLQAATLQQMQAAGGAKLTISDAAPGTPAVGDLWFCSADGNLYLRHNDGTSTQWVGL